MGFVRDVRLPRHVIPEVYNLTLIPFIVEVCIFTCVMDMVPEQTK